MYLQYHYSEATLWLTLRFIYEHIISGFHSLQYFIEWRFFLLVQQVESYTCFNIILVCYERGLRCRSFIIGPWDLSLFYSQLIVIWVLKTSMDLIIVDLGECVRKFDFDPDNTWASHEMMRVDIQQQIYYIGLLHCASPFIRLTNRYKVKFSLVSLNSYFLVVVFAYTSEVSLTQNKTYHIKRSTWGGLSHIIMVNARIIYMIFSSKYHLMITKIIFQT